MVLVWSGGKPAFRAAPLPAHGLILGRELVAQLGGVADDATSPAHARIEATGDELAIVALEPTTAEGVVVNGRQALAPPAVIRTGGAVWMVVADLTPYQIELQRHGRWVVGASSRRTYDDLQGAARAEVNILVRGSRPTGLQVADAYGAIVGGGSVRFEPRRTRAALEEVLATRPRVLQLVLPDRYILEPPDVATLASWLETDLRVVTIAEADRPMLELPREILARLSVRTVCLPSWRFDEVPVMVWDIVRALAPDAKLASDAVEHCLLAAASSGSGWVLHKLRSVVRGWRERHRETLGAGDLTSIELPRSSAEIGVLVAPRPESTYLLSREDRWRLTRPLCTDALCPGALGPAGCEVCGAPTPVAG